MRQIAAAIQFLFVMAILPSAWAEAPVARIEGPATVPVGKSIVLSAESSVSDRPLEWQVRKPAGLPLFVSDKAPRKHVYAAILDAEPGEYEITVKAKGKVGDEWESDIALYHVIVGGPAPVPPGPQPVPPGPGPQPPTPSRFGLEAVIHEAYPAVSLPPEIRKLTTKALAGSYEALSRTTPGQGDFNAANAAARAANRATLGAHLDAWKPALDAIGGRLAELGSTGLIATVADLAAAQHEIALALTKEATD